MNFAKVSNYLSCYDSCYNSCYDLWQS